MMHDWRSEGSLTHRIKTEAKVIVHDIDDSVRYIFFFMLYLLSIMDNFRYQFILRRDDNIEVDRSVDNCWVVYKLVRYDLDTVT